MRGKGQRLVKALKLVLEAYCLFDRDGSGAIDKEEVLAMRGFWKDRPPVDMAKLRADRYPNLDLHADR